MLALLALLLSTVTNVNTSSSYACDGAQTVYSVGFPYGATSEIVVTSTTPTGVATTLAITTDYTLSLASTQSIATLTLTAGSKCPNLFTLRIGRVTPLTQPINLRTQGPLRPETLETMYDRLTRQLQEIKGAVPPLAKGQILVGSVDGTKVLPAGSGGQTLLADPSQSTGVLWGAGTSGGNYIAPGAGAVSRTLASKLSETISVMDFGATGSNDCAPALQAAINASGGSATILIPSNFNCSLNTGPVNVNVGSITIMGEGFGSRLRVNHSGDAFVVSAPLFHLENLEVHYDYTLARATSSLIVGNAQFGTIHNIRIDGNGSSTNNGIVFKSTGFGTGAGIWKLDNIICCTDSTTWANFALITNSSGTTTATIFSISNVTVFGKFSDAAVAVDGTIDTVIMTNFIAGTATADSLGPMLHLRNTVGGISPGYPRWIHCNDCYFEAPARTVVKVDNVKDFQYRGYIATGTIGIAVGANSINSLIDGTHFVNVNQSCLTVASGSEGTIISNNHFDECGVQTTNTYHSLSIAANASNFFIRGNDFANRAANKPAYGINIAPGTSTGYVISDNNLRGTFGTGTINNQGSGTSTVLSNLPLQAAGVEHTASHLLLIGMTQINNTLYNDGSGVKHKRVGGCATAASAGAVCTTTISWGTAFPDASYTVTCTGDLVTSGVPLNGGFTAKVAASVTFQTVAATAAAAQYTNIDCVAAHD